LISGLVLAGGGSVLAAAGGSSADSSSSKQQYCPPNSPGGGQPQGGPENNCGNPPDKCPNGDPKPPNGNCGNPPEKCPNGEPKPPSGNCGKGPKTPHSGGEGKKAKVRVHKHPRKGCISRTFSARISVSNRAKGRKTFVFRDGRRIKSSRKRAFKVRFDVRRLSPGVHKVKIRVRGQDGRMVTKVVRFRRC
jgi:hypothetical protein